jgi:ABC-type glutathione transport system ATPase component
MSAPDRVRAGDPFSAILEEERMAALIEFRDVSKTFTVGSTEVKALQSITLDIDAGDIFAIIGGSGAGKSTLVRLINALESATSGQVSIEGIDLTRLREKDIRKIRSRMGMIFQQFRQQFGHPLLLLVRPVGRNSGSALPARWPPTRRSCWPTSPPARWTRRQPPTS